LSPVISSGFFSAFLKVLPLTQTFPSPRFTTASALLRVADLERLRSPDLRVADLERLRPLELERVLDDERPLELERVFEDDRPLELERVLEDERLLELERPFELERFFFFFFSIVMIPAASIIFCEKDGSFARLERLRLRLRPLLDFERPLLDFEVDLDRLRLVEERLFGDLAPLQVIGGAELNL